MRKQKAPTMYRQGDVLITLIEGYEPARGKPEKREGGAVVLAHGEVTGHSHRIASRSASLFALESDRLSGESAMQMISRLGGGVIPDRLLEVKAPVDLVHEEHATIKLPAGKYIVSIQREYQPGSLRSVAD